MSKNPSSKKTKTKKVVKKVNKETKENSQEFDRYRSNLLSIISHELNTPLTGMINAISILEERYPKENEFLPMLKRNTHRLKRTVENLLEISRADAGTIRVRLTELDLDHFVRSREEVLKPEIEKQDFVFSLELEEDLPRVCGDARRLAHVFDALVYNALKFSRLEGLNKTNPGKIHIKLSLESESEIPRGIVSLREQKTGMYLILSVQSSQSSVGETPETFEELFEPFSPWRDADTRVKEGLGVELAIAKEILIAHYGFIWATDTDGVDGGWKFSIALPILSRVDELDLVINNRLFSAIGALSKISLVLLRAEPGYKALDEDYPKINKALQRVLFRTSDSIFWISESGELAILMDDCGREGAQRVVERLKKVLAEEISHIRFLVSYACGPEDGSSALELLEKARSSWEPLGR
ncbi:MAG: ATP-binding protein [Oligoflexia bacterium]|nr:ATP-binding protein [Oligoflexia bacterium]